MQAGASEGMGCMVAAENTVSATQLELQQLAGGESAYLLVSDLGSADCSGQDVLQSWL
jgi:hypothetical protein